jgi:hypothetical protein
VLYVIKYGIYVKKVGVEDKISSSRELWYFKVCNIARLIYIRAETWETTYLEINLTFGLKIGPILLKVWFLKLGSVFFLEWDPPTIGGKVAPH